MRHSHRVATYKIVPKAQKRARKFLPCVVEDGASTSRLVQCLGLVAHTQPGKVESPVIVETRLVYKVDDVYLGKIYDVVPGEFPSNQIVVVAAQGLQSILSSASTFADVRGTVIAVMEGHEGLGPCAGDPSLVEGRLQ